ncbi:MAG: hypothetical protein K9M03_02830 [Kiritimatiellales bacterium]|nr:hypothetical protein [Kiritimatiellales bacterium]
MADDDKNITLKMVMDHITMQIGTLKAEMDKRFDAVDKRFEVIEDRVDILAKDSQANHEDLVATMKQMVTVSEHVGISVD